MKTYRKYPGSIRQEGAETVEFIVTLPVVLIVAAMMLDLGFLFSDRIILTDAARAAAREVINGSSSTVIQAASDQVTQSMMSSDPSALPTVSVSCTGPCDTKGEQAEVTVSNPYTFMLLPAFVSTAANITLSATVRMNMLRGS